MQLSPRGDAIASIQQQQTQQNTEKVDTGLYRILNVRKTKKIAELALESGPDVSVYTKTRANGAKYVSQHKKFIFFNFAFLKYYNAA